MFYVKDCNTNKVLLSGQGQDGLYALSRAFESSVYLINCMLIHVLANRSPFDCLFLWSPDCHFYAHLGVSTFPFCILITIINWIFVPFRACFLVTTPRTLVIDVLTLHLNLFISLIMSAFMTIFFHLKILNRLQRSLPLPHYNPPLLS